MARPPLLSAADGGPGLRPEHGAGGRVTDSSRFGGLAVYQHQRALQLIGLYVQFFFPQLSNHIDFQSSEPG